MSADEDHGGGVSVEKPSRHSTQVTSGGSIPCERNPWSRTARLTRWNCNQTPKGKQDGYLADALRGRALPCQNPAGCESAALGLAPPIRLNECPSPTSRKRLSPKEECQSNKTSRRLCLNSLPRIQTRPPSNMPPRCAVVAPWAPSTSASCGNLRPTLSSCAKSWAFSFRAPLLALPRDGSQRVRFARQGVSTSTG